ncbi:hypothetical protein [Amycolatopsis sp. H20-H5]|uniref:hypothetical protein n=1 Tax=Amycolatopsis sp. H20-H5 TaxID=3046309 RepID=UPI002DBC7D1B|nr:hypothetical protein [Amycolatopsis sp. H20-H5]MEC3977435.1 hypothetical protein [Amycolatopsis sp. H20-H5]
MLDQIEREGAPVSIVNFGLGFVAGEHGLVSATVRRHVRVRPGESLLLPPVAAGQPRPPRRARPGGVDADRRRGFLSEVLDGVDPIYPPAVQDDSGYFIVYATPASLYEIVSQSRSLSAGRGWIGTCPYLFLVHLMTLHNEDLVRRYEYQVRTLIEHLKKVGPLGSADDVGRWRRGLKVDETFTMFRHFRLSRFQEVHRHRYFNVLRYDTERAFYHSIAEVRGIRQREQYWSEVVADLESAVDDLREAGRRRADDRRNKLLAAVAVIGVLQVVFQVLNYFFEKGLAKIEWAVGSTVVTLLVVAVIVGPWWRSEK